MTFLQQLHHMIWHSHMTPLIYLIYEEREIWLIVVLVASSSTRLSKNEDPPLWWLMKEVTMPNAQRIFIFIKLEFVGETKDSGGTGGFGILSVLKRD